MSYITRHRFNAGDQVPRWINRVAPAAYQPYLTFTQECVVVATYPARHVDIHPVVHAAFQPHFTAFPLLAFDPPPNDVPRFYITGPRGQVMMHEETAPGEPWSPDAITLDFAEPTP